MKTYTVYKVCSFLWGVAAVYNLLTFLSLPGFAGFYLFLVLFDIGLVYFYLAIYREELAREKAIAEDAGTP